ncbi:MAG: iron-sulfur cluster assembly protein [Candidatus Aenigmatarchaeota archaeon]
MPKTTKVSKAHTVSKKPKTGSSNIPDNVMKVLKSVKDPHTGQFIFEAGMLTNIKVSGKKVKMRLVAPGMGCECCGMIGDMTNELSEGLKKIGYEADIEVGF